MANMAHGEVRLEAVELGRRIVYNERCYLTKRSRFW
jgi:hypothetical protein